MGAPIGTLLHDSVIQARDLLVSERHSMEVAIEDEAAGIAGYDERD